MHRAADRPTLHVIVQPLLARPGRTFEADHPTMDTQPTTLHLDRSADGVLKITLDRPDTRNALNTQMGRELRDLFAPLVFQANDARCIIVTGSGDKAFCAGGDLKER